MMYWNTYDENIAPKKRMSAQKSLISMIENFITEFELGEEEIVELYDRIDELLEQYLIELEQRNISI